SQNTTAKAYKTKSKSSTAKQPKSFPLVTEFAHNIEDAIAVDKAIQALTLGHSVVHLIDHSINIILCL
ncbi:hypothetical protein CVT25_014747, partial [Psilocybe cyanescens]